MNNEPDFRDILENSDSKWYKIPNGNNYTYLPEREYILLQELNKIINAVDNGYLWRELCGFEFNLKQYL